MFELMRREPRLVQDLFKMVGDPMLSSPFFVTETEDGNLAVDVSEKDGEVIVRASLPGFDEEDIDVQIHNGVLTIKAEHTEETETKDERFYRKERRYGSVARRITLPGIVSEADAKAELKAGVLELRIPQSAEARPKQIPIKTN